MKHDYKLLLQVSAFFDVKDGLLKCFGRHGNVEGTYITDKSFEKIIIPDKTLVSAILIRSTHADLSHIGPIAVHAFLSRDYWIIRSIQEVTNVLAKCIECRAQKAISKSPQMAVIPRVRLEMFQPPFTNCGIDCIGPIFIKYKEGRNITRKSHILAFSCLNTRACEFCLLRDMTTDSFLLSLDTFK